MVHERSTVVNGVLVDSGACNANTPWCMELSALFLLVPVDDRLIYLLQDSFMIQSPKSRETIGGLKIYSYFNYATSHLGFFWGGGRLECNCRPADNHLTFARVKPACDPQLRDVGHIGWRRFGAPLVLLRCLSQSRLRRGLRNSCM